MRHRTRRPGGFLLFPRSRGRRGGFPRLLGLAIVLCLGALAAILSWDVQSPRPPASDVVRDLTPVIAVPARRSIALLDPTYSLGMAPLPLGQSMPLASGLTRTSPALIDIAMLPPEATAPAPLASSVPAPATPAPGQSVPVAPKLVLVAPIPMPRPSGLPVPIAQAPAVQPPAAVEPPKTAARPLSRRARNAAKPTVAQDNRSFFEKLFGVQPSQGTALAYAAPQDDIVDQGRGRRLSPISPPMLSSAQATAVYDISAKTVYMPNGDRLEAHSGLGDKLDDPRYAHVRMQGVTPPHTYDLTEREALFHGVRALRLNPVGGSGAIHGRAGLLTHTYLLGPNGDSNGCVSFKDYDKFLQAFLRGEVKRLVVVAGRG